MFPADGVGAGIEAPLESWLLLELSTCLPHDTAMPRTDRLRRNNVCAQIKTNLRTLGA